MQSVRNDLQAYLHHKMAGFQTGLNNKIASAVMLDTLARSIHLSGDKTQWKRRPSISDDGMPIVLSYKADREREEHIRLLVEAGTLQMSVAQQIAYALTELDRLLGLLSWRGAAAQINTILKQVLPVDASQTARWRGGIWLGADVKIDGSEEELRLYLNLRHGSRDERWQRLVSLVTGFATDSIAPFLRAWQPKAMRFAVPVGLGIVVADGFVKGIRTYVSVETPSVTSVEAVITGFERHAHKTIASVFGRFISDFGVMPPHSVTVGFDFVPERETPYRTKIDISCQSINVRQGARLARWIAAYLAQWSFDPRSFREFMDDIHRFWHGSVIQYFSLGFAPKLQHATVYVQPTS